MSFAPKVLVTGATGFLGAAFIARIIDTPQFDDCLFLVRADLPEDGLARLIHVLRGHGLTEPQLDKVHLHQILCGSLNDVADWEDDPRLPSIERVLSSAAIASFGNHPSIWPTNVDGVMDMARVLARRAKVQRFLQIGTAMACGRQAEIPVPEGYDAGADTVPFLEYTDSKYTVEHRIAQELPELPLIVARPSIVVGHTKLGCTPSGSIFWVFRIARALQAFPCDLDQQIDVIPADYCAQAIDLLLNKPVLAHKSYHISAGPKRASTFDEIDQSIAKAVNGRPLNETYVSKSVEEIALMQDQFNTLLGPCNRRIVLRAIKTYGDFSRMEMLFLNDRLLAEGMPEPTPLAAYAGLCEMTSRHQLIADQMKFDYK